jgi:glycosidase
MQPSLLRIVLLVLTTVAHSSSMGDAAKTDLHRKWNQDIIYFAITDRFMDGDPSNNVPTESDPDLYDSNQQDINKYHGGDLRGLELALQSGYFNDLGITAIWITPPVRNAWHSCFDMGGPKTGYHGYWAQDFLDIDPHLVSSISLAGVPYTNDRDGRMQHYKDFVALAHRCNIKIVQDVVCNHIGPLFYYDDNHNGQFDAETKSEWISPFKDSGTYSNTTWINRPEWNLVQPTTTSSMKILGEPIAVTGVFEDFSVYGRKGFSDDSLGKSDGEEVQCDFFALRDFDTSKDSPHFDRLVDEFVEIYRFYIEEIGIDGLRMDTVKHVHHEFWDAFTQRLRSKLGDRAKELIIFGEVYDGSPKALGKYTFRTDSKKNSAPCFDSLLNFQYCFCLREFLRTPDQSCGSSASLAKVIQTMNLSGERSFYNETVGQDGLSARQKMINFFENHDGLNRFLSSKVDSFKQELATVLTMFVEGIPCLYYGSEFSLRDTDGVIGNDGETGRMTYCKTGGTTTLDEARQSGTFQLVRSMAELRTSSPVLTDGRCCSLSFDRPESEVDDGSFVVARYLRKRKNGPCECYVLFVNASNSKSTPASANGAAVQLLDPQGMPLLKKRQALVKVPIASHLDTSLPVRLEVHWDKTIPSVELTIEPKSFGLYKVE